MLFLVKDLIVESFNEMDALEKYNNNSGNKIYGLKEINNKAIKLTPELIEFYGDEITSYSVDEDDSLNAGYATLYKLGNNNYEVIEWNLFSTQHRVGEITIKEIVLA